MGPKKNASKRQSLKMKYKIEKKVKEHKRKLRKFARDNPHLARRKRKDPGVPNLFPFKEEMIMKAERARARESDLRDTQRAARKKVIEKKRQASLEKMAAEARGDYVPEEVDTRTTNDTDISKRHWYFREMRRVVDASDVILEVLDARDPMGCRCPEVEKMILQYMDNDGAANKRIILVLNKIDLVPSDVVSKWVRQLRREYPTIAFKASTQKQKGNLGNSRSRQTKKWGKAGGAGGAKSGGGKGGGGGKGAGDEANVEISSCVGANALLQLLKNYSRALNLKKSITVGIVGFPNVGKSSLINSMKRSRACAVAPTPGYTTVVQSVKLDKNISLLDSPGVLFASETDKEDPSLSAEEREKRKVSHMAQLALRNCVKVEQVEDPSEAVGAIVAKFPKEQLMEIYEIANFNTVDEFLMLVAHKRGKLGKGGVPNLTLAGRAVLQDWNLGKIPFYTLPPEQNKDEEKTMISDYSKEFDIEKLLNAADSEVQQGLSTGKQMEHSFVAVEGNPTLPLAIMESQGAQDGDAMDDKEDEGSVVTAGIDMAKVEKSKQKKIKKSGGTHSGGLASDQQRNKTIKNQQKKAKKEARRAAAAAAGGTANMDADDDDGSYSFETDFHD